MFKNKVLLITGGTGSFGSAALKRFMKTDLKEIRIFSRDERKQDELRRIFHDKRVNFIIGNVRDERSVNSAMGGVNFVFHAAALKQVPSCEFFPMQAVKTNIYGTENVIDSAINNNVERVVVLSTDKAVYPINAMGMTKALMEKVMISKSRHSKNTLLCGTRYGNIMGSRGSVIPLFIQQIKNKKKITVTNPNMTRFMMSLEDSIDLVLYAFKNASQGDIFVQKAPAATIETTVNALKELFEANNPVGIIGVRHGEKTYETLVSAEEMTKAIDLGGYFKVPVDKRDLNYEEYFTKGDKSIPDMNEYNSHNTSRLDVEKTKQMLIKLDFVKNALNSKE